MGLLQKVIGMFGRDPEQEEKDLHATEERIDKVGKKLDAERRKRRIDARIDAGSAAGRR